MSSTNRGAERQPDDFYETPAWAVRALLPQLTPGPVIDPFAGRGAILDAVRDVWGERCCALELDAIRAAICGAKHYTERRDSFDERAWPSQEAVITNPPFARAMDAILRAAREAPRRERAFLLRLNFLGSQGRALFHREHPADIHVLPKRPEFVASIKCKAENTNGKRVGCGWTVVQMIDMPRPGACPSCGSLDLQISTTDSCEYAWWIWGPGRGGRWSILDCSEVSS